MQPSSSLVSFELISWTTARSPTQDSRLRIMPKRLERPGFSWSREISCNREIRSNLLKQSCNSNAPNPPLRLPLGSDALQRIIDKGAFVAQEMREWRALSES